MELLDSGTRARCPQLRLVYELAFAPSYHSDGRVDMCLPRSNSRARDDELEANLD